MTEESAIDQGPARPYLPAMGRPWLLPLYDPFTQLLGARRVHGELLDQAGLRPGAPVLEIGCGTGNLLLAAKRRCPGAQVAGLDPDPAAVRRTARKAARARLAVTVEVGYADALPYPDRSVDRVLSSFMLHHLEPGDLPRALAEVRRVLRPGGELHVVDIVGGGHHRNGLLGRLARRRHGAPAAHGAHGAHGAGSSEAHGTPDAPGAPARLLGLLADAGLRDAAETGRGSVRVGDYAFHRAVR